MKKETYNLGKSDKILVFMYELKNDGRPKINYEDLVVGLFKRFPQDFHLKGYTEYPDSDLIDKPLYQFKKKGYLNITNKVFSLTDRGAEFAEELSRKNDMQPESSKDQLSRTAETEVSRIKSLEGFELYIQHQKDKLSDNDFYSYLGVTVRTSKNTFIGRLESMNAVMEDLRTRTDNPLYASVVSYHDFLQSKHQDIITFFTK